MRRQFEMMDLSSPQPPVISKWKNKDVLKKRLGFKMAALIIEVIMRSIISWQTSHASSKVISNNVKKKLPLMFHRKVRKIAKKVRQRTRVYQVTAQEVAEERNAEADIIQIEEGSVEAGEEISEVGEGNNEAGNRSDQARGSGATATHGLNSQ